MARAFSSVITRLQGALALKGIGVGETTSDCRWRLQAGFQLLIQLSTSGDMIILWSDAPGFNAANMGLPYS